jgi:hypothetical protein
VEGTFNVTNAHTKALSLTERKKERKKEKKRKRKRKKKKEFEAVKI